VWRRLRLVLVTNIPAPYRLPIYTRLGQRPDLDLHVLFCSEREPDREWNLGEASFPHTYLPGRVLSYRGRYVHVNQDVWAALSTLRPDVVVTTGFNPTHLLAYLWSRRHAAAHVPMTDGTLESESVLTPVHRWVRRRVYARSTAFVAASDGGRRLYRSYGVDEAAIFKSHLCADNERFARAGASSAPKSWDFLFCGRFVPTKNPGFALEVAREVAVRLGRRVSLVFVGSGELEAGIRARAASLSDHVEPVFAGFARQEDLPRWYGASRVLLFPTSWDPWGVVANEACAAGVPVLISDRAGSAGELVRDGENGFVLPLDRETWVTAAIRLLTEPRLHEAMARRCQERVSEYTYDNAARGLAEAVLAADRAVPAWGARRSRTQPKVVVVQRRMTHYRVPLFERLRERLSAAGVTLVVAYGDPLPREVLRKDEGSLPWGVHVPTRYWLDGRLCWHSVLPHTRDAELVVVTQENRLLFNYLWAILKGQRKWAFWGHGRNFQTTRPASLRERFKRWLAGRVDWWFAYTALSRAAVLEAGFPGERITVLNNAIDTSELAALLRSVDAAAVAEARRAFGVGPGTVCVALGSLHRNKRLGFLLDAASRVRGRVPDFHLVLLGDGPDRELVARRAAEAGGWITWLGARTGREKALVLAMSRLMLNPGMVGLAVLDSFVAGVPMVTTAHSQHSPEIAYLDSGRNGLITEDSLEAFVDGVLGLLADPARLSRLSEGCRVSAREYSIERMADNFRDGILACLARDGGR
jgi:glycosyltransferase involved in cell wall biosynthesis